MNKLFLSLSLLSLSLCAACGSGGNAFSQGSGGSGHLTNASLNGQYVYQLSGNDLTSGASVEYREAGVFVADGNGHITSGTDDFSEGTSGASNSSISGSYSVGNDGTGSITLSFSTGGSISLAITLVSSSKLYLIENDAGLNAAGLAEKQDSTAIASAPNGAFVFKFHTTSTSQGSAALVGVMNVSAGVVSSGSSEDANRGGTSTSLTLTSGLFNGPTGMGRGSGSFTDNSGTTSFNYYIVDANNIRFLVSTPGINGIGRAEAQSSTAALTGSYAFGSKGDDSYALGGVVTVGQLIASGGSITSGTYDAVQDGNPVANAPFTGTYTSTGGRTVVSLSTGIQQVFYTVSSSRAFFLTMVDPTDASNVEDGTADLQQSSSFSNASVKGQFAFVMKGLTGIGSFIDRVGWLQWDGVSALSLSEEANSSTTGLGGQPFGILTGTYSITSNGRAAGTINNFSLSSNDFVVYLISGTDGYLLQNDAGEEINGKMSQQVQ